MEKEQERFREMTIVSVLVWLLYLKMQYSEFSLEFRFSESNLSMSTTTAQHHSNVHSNPDYTVTLFSPDSIPYTLFTVCFISGTPCKESIQIALCTFIMKFKFCVLFCCEFLVLYLLLKEISVHSVHIQFVPKLDRK